MNSINAKYIQRRISEHFYTHDYQLDNKYIFGWESDFFCISKSGYCTEVEIKISKSDFRADFKKETINRINKHKFILNDSSIRKPNKFYFAFPVGMVDSIEIPKEYGIIEIDTNRLIIKRRAKFIHKEKLLNHNFFLRKLLNKFYWNYHSLKLASNE